jgi:hypothetical protein
MSDFKSIDFKPNVYKPDVTNIQELVAYCDAQFCAVLRVVTSLDNLLKRGLYCKILAMELVSTLMIYCLPVIDQF